MKHIDLSLIDPNPWQPRQHMDPAGIEELAADIATRQASRPDTWGLLQVPAARIVDANGIPLETTNLEIGEAGLRVQLAYGHRRHAAFALLAAKVKDWPQTMPLEIVTFSDEEMASAAWSENMARKDLTAIEEAEFIARFLEDFKLSHKDAAERLAMARSTLSNRLRLLKLPEDIRTHVRTGAMPERTALALLPLYDLPAERVERYEAEAESWVTKPSEVIAEALAGQDSDTVRQRVSSVVGRMTTRIEDWLPLDYEFAVEGVVQPACTGCPNLLQAHDRKFCLEKACVALKEAAWPDIALARASEATGILIDDVDEADAPYALGDWWELEDDVAEELGARVLGMTCEYRRLVYDPDRGGTPLDAEKYPGVLLGCIHSACPCALAVTDGYLAEHPEYQAAKNDEAAQRQEKEREWKERQRQHEEEWAERESAREQAWEQVRTQLLDPAKNQLAARMAAGDLVALSLLTLDLWEMRRDDLSKIKERIVELDADSVWQTLAESVLGDLQSYSDRHSMAATRANLQKLIDLGVAIELPAEDEKPTKKKRSKEVVK